MKATTLLLLLTLPLQTNTASGMFTRSQAAQLRVERDYLLDQLADIASSLEENRGYGNWQAVQQWRKEQGCILKRIKQINRML